jgi:putative heme-binding domain-containing protein
VTTGLVRREQDGALVYADVTGQEHSVPKSQVAGDDVSPFSLMPSGLGEVLTEQQLHDLLAYLLERK